MLICPKCNTNNPLGRVFCSGCGEKLDLKHMSKDEVADSQKESWLKEHGKVLIIAGSVVLVAVIGLALWPKSDLIGEEGTRSGLSKVSRALRSTERVRPGGTPKNIAFTEKDINGYFACGKAKRLDLGSVSVDLQDSAFTVRAIKVFKQREIWNFTIEPRFSLELVCVVEGDKTKVKMASVGHLPLWGPTGIPVALIMKNVLAKDKECACIKHFAETKVADEKITITIRKKKQEKKAPKKK